MSTLSKLNKIMALFLIAFSLTGCYTMPGEDDYSLVPTTNNPDITREKSDSFMPQMSY